MTFLSLLEEFISDKVVSNVADKLFAIIDCASVTWVWSCWQSPASALGEWVSGTPEEGLLNSIVKGFLVKGDYTGVTNVA